jgi:hypothetical protein
MGEPSVQKIDPCGNSAGMSFAPGMYELPLQAWVSPPRTGLAAELQAWVKRHPAAVTGLRRAMRAGKSSRRALNEAEEREDLRD